MSDAQPIRTERLEKLAKWQGPVYQEEAYNMAEEILRLRSELEQVKQRNVKLREAMETTRNVIIGLLLYEDDGCGNSGSQSRGKYQ